MSRHEDGSVIVKVHANTTEFKKDIDKLKATTVKAFAAISAAVGGASLFVLKAGIEFESAFAGVRKTVDATEEEFKEFEKSLLNLSTKMPQSAAQLASIAEAAGQLGIKNENLMKFTESMAQLGDATNMASEEAATSLARFANVTGMSQDNFDRLGSSVVALGNNMATTESEIVDMALNIAGAATQVGMSENQIMAFSAALSSVGIEAAAGGTAISTLLIDMKKATLQGGDDLKKFADAANVTSEQFKKAFEEDATNAVSMFVRGLATAELRGKDAFKILEEVGINETRMTKAMLNLSGASSVLTDAIAISSGAWEENTALMKEAEQRYQTTESKLKLLQNGLTQTGITIFEKIKVPFKDALDTGISSLNELNDELQKGDLGKEVDILAQTFTDLSKSVLDAGVKAIPAIIKSLTWFIKNGDKIISIVSSMGAGFAFYKGASKTKKVIDGIAKSWNAADKVLNDYIKAGTLLDVVQRGSLKRTEIGVAALTGKIKLWTAAQAACNSISPVGWLTMLVSVMGLVCVGLSLSSKRTDEYTRKIKEQNELIKEAKKRTEELNNAAEEQYKTRSREIMLAERYARSLQDLVDENGKFTGSKEEAIEKVEKLNEALGTNKFYYDENTKTIRDADGAVKDLSASITELIRLQKAQAWLDANKDAYVETFKERDKIIKSNIESYKKLQELQQNNAYAEEIKNLEEIKQAYADGKIDYESYTIALGQIPYAAQKAAQDIKALEISQKKANDEIVKMTDSINTYELMMKSLEDKDYSKINSIITGLSAAQLGGDYSGVVDILNRIMQCQNELKDTEEYGLSHFLPEEKKKEIQDRLEDIKKSFKEFTGYDFDKTEFASGGKKVMDKFIQDIEDGKEPAIKEINTVATDLVENMNETMDKSFTEDEKLKDGLKTNVTNALDSLNEPIEEEATKNADSFNNKWNDSVNNQMPSSTLKAFEKTRLDLNNAINSFTPNPIVIPVIAQAKSNFSKYGLSIGGATYDGTTGGSFINEKYSDIVSSSKKVIQKMQSKIGRTVLQAKESKSDSTSKNVSVNQVNNFNVEVDKPSKISRDFEQTTKKLASSL